MLQNYYFLCMLFKFVYEAARLRRQFLYSRADRKFT